MLRSTNLLVQNDLTKVTTSKVVFQCTLSEYKSSSFYDIVLTSLVGPKQTLIMADRLKDKKTRANQRKTQHSFWMSTLNEAKKRKATGDVIPCTPPAPIIQ